MDVLIFLLALSVVVVFHEWGHFWAALKMKVRVEEFGLGMPPRIWAKRKGRTVFSINLLPIGGFCRLYGENELKKGRGAFCQKKAWQKGVIVAGGVVMNLVLAVIIFSAVYTILGVPEETDKVKVMEVAAESPAQKAGLKEGDWIVGVGQVKISQPGQLVEEVEKHKGGKAELVVVTEGEEVKRVVEVEVREEPPEGEGRMGVAISNIQMMKVPWWQFYKGVAAGFREAFFWGKIISSGIWQMIGRVLAGKLPEGVAGPVGMYQATSSIKRNQGLLAMVHFFGIISVNLAILNFLPFPALDGGRMVFVIWEAVWGKRVPEKVENAINGAGFAFLLLLLVLVTIGDVSRLISRGG